MIILTRPDGVEFLVDRAAIVTIEPVEVTRLNAWPKEAKTIIELSNGTHRAIREEVSFFQ